jgi:hypothetical protein
MGSLRRLHGLCRSLSLLRVLSGLRFAWLLRCFWRIGAVLVRCALERSAAASVVHGWAMVCAHLRAVFMASAFNRNVGGWNVARVLSISSVCCVASHASGLDCRMMCFEPQALDGVSTAFARLAHASAHNSSSPLLRCTNCTGPSSRRAWAAASAAQSTLTQL